MTKSLKLEIVTPNELFYKGDVEMVIVRTTLGEEAFLAKHSWACKLLDEKKGKIQIREPGAGALRVAKIVGGYIDVKENIVVYTDFAEWIKSE